MSSSTTVSTPDGRLIITDDVVEAIAAHAVQGCPGVAGLAGRGLSNILREKAGRGVKAHMEDASCWLELDVQVLFGHAIPRVAELLTTRVKEAVEDQAGIRVERVELHIVGVVRGGD